MPNGPTDADISAVAQDAHVVVGDVPLVLPFIALPDYVSAATVFSLNRSAGRAALQKKQDDFRVAASSLATAPTLATLRVRIETFGWENTNFPKWDRFCGRLTRDWSRAVCTDPQALLLQTLPSDGFYLADDRHLDVFSSHGTVGGENRWHQLQTMTLQAGQSSIACDRNVPGKQRFCTAAHPIADHLVAVWTVWDDDRESAAVMAEREGRAVGALVWFSLGEAEDFAALQDVLCTARRPSAAGTSTQAAAEPCAQTDRLR